MDVVGGIVGHRKASDRFLIWEASGRVKESLTGLAPIYWHPIARRVKTAAVTGKHRDSYWTIVGQRL